MVNLQRGRTGQADLITEVIGGDPGFQSEAKWPAWGVYQRDGGGDGILVADFATDGSAAIGAGGWDTDESGTIQIPLGAALGEYYAVNGYNPRDNGDPPNYIIDSRTFEFNVVAKQSWVCALDTFTCEDQGEDWGGSSSASEDECMENCAARQRFVCMSGTCVAIDTVTSEGFETLEECLAACGGGGGDGCTLAGTLTYERVSGNQFRVTGTASGATGAVGIVFSTSAGTLANDTDNTVLVNVAAGTTLVVTATFTDDACSTDPITVTVDGSTEDGGSSCTVDISLALVRLPDDKQAISVNLSGAQSGAPILQFFVDSVETAPDAGTTNKITVTVPFGGSKTFIAIVRDGTCADSEKLILSNADGIVIPPPPPGDADCIDFIGNYQRDVNAPDAYAGNVIGRARFGFELRDDCTNPACQYYFQAYHSSDSALSGIYTPEALAAHFPLPLTLGQFQDAQGARQKRQQVLAGDLMRPATNHVHLRITADPVFELWPLDTIGDVVKIRDLSETTVFLFTTAPARVLKYSSAGSGAIGSDRAGTVSVLKDLAALGATDATDAMLLDDKIYIARPGEVFVADLTTGENTLNSGIRGESGTVRLEVVNGKPLIFYIDTATRCYDLSFSPGKLLWTLPVVVTQTQVAGDKLLLAAGAALYSAIGTALPTLQNTFPANINALANGYVGLATGAVYRLFSSGWTLATTLVGPAGALWPWLGGAEQPRALAGASSGTGANVLRAEQETYNWTNDRTLTDATGVRSMRVLSRDVTPMTETTPAVLDERMLIGDDNGTLWVYLQRPKPEGAVVGYHIALPRILPLQRLAPTIA